MTSITSTVAPANTACVYTISGLANLWGCPLEDAKLFVEEAIRNHRLLTVVGEQGELLVPAFQLDKQLCLRPELFPVLEPLLQARVPSWRVWAWLVSPDGSGAPLQEDEASRQQWARAARRARTIAYELRQRRRDKVA